MNRVLVAADSSTDRRLLVALLESDPDFMVIAETDNGVEAVDLTVRLEPDMVAMDLDMPLMNGIEATRAIMERCPTRIVILSSSNENGTELGRGADALKAGALTVVPRPDHPNSSQFNMRREMFMEMVRAASRKVPGLGKDPRYEERRERKERGEPMFGGATTWLRPVMHFTSPFDSQELPGDTTPDGDIRIFGLPFTVEDRAERLRRLLDEIADEGEF
jgi:chemotaxis response regulator CheB